MTGLYWDMGTGSALAALAQSQPSFRIDQPRNGA
jgi:hypothetical protein